MANVIGDQLYSDNLIKNPNAAGGELSPWEGLGPSIVDGGNNDKFCFQLSGQGTWMSQQLTTRTTRDFLLAFNISGDTLDQADIRILGVVVVVLGYDDGTKDEIVIPCEGGPGWVEVENYIPADQTEDRDLQTISVTMRMLEEGTLKFDDIVLLRNITADKILGNNIVYLRLPTGCIAYPVFAAVLASKIVAAHIIIGEQMSSQIDVWLDNRTSGVRVGQASLVVGTSPYLSIDFDIDAGDLNPGDVIEFGAGPGLPEILLVIEWNLR